MIFKTFQSDLDGISNKIGFSKRSFAEWGKQISTSFKESEGVVNKFKNTLKTAFTVPVEKDNSWIKNNLGDIVTKENIDSFIPKLNTNSARAELELLQGIQNKINETKGSWDDYNNNFKDGRKYLLDYAKSHNVLESSVDDVKEANQQARASALAHNEAIKAQTLSAKAGTVAFKALSIAGNMLVAWAISKIISIVAEKIDNLAHSAEYCKERVDELMSSYKSALDKANSNAKTVEELASRYETLSKGVNNLGENVSLATDEYTEYNKIVNQIADIFPTLVQGWTDEGNAILSLKGNVEQLRNAYKEAQQEAYNLLIIDGKDSDGNDIIKNYNNIANGDVYHNNARKIRFLDEIYDASNSVEGLEKVWKKVMAGDYAERIGELGAYSDFFLEFTKIHSYEIQDLTETDLAAIKQNLKALKQTYQAEINYALKDVQTLANAYLMTNKDYVGLDEQSKNASSIIVNSINEGIANGFETKIDVGAYVNKIVDMIKNNPGIEDALVGLFSLDMNDMSVSEAKELLDIYITTINEELEEDPVELKARLGFADIDNTYNRLRNSIGEIVDDCGIYDEEDYAYLSEYTKGFTQAQIELWLKATRGAENAAQAVEMYEDALEKKKEEATRLSAVLTNSTDSLDKFQSSVKSAADAYATLLSVNYSSSELLDSIQAINKAAADMGETIDWESIAASDNPLKAIQDEIESVSNTYSESVLSGAGINTNSDFGKMLANIVQEAYKSEAALSSLNTQIDSLQSAYNDLTDIVDSYNKTGYVTFNQLQTLLAMEPQYLSCLIDENGQLQLNQEAMQALANQRLNDARAQIIEQTITELGELQFKKEKTAIEGATLALEDNDETITSYEERLLDFIPIAELTTEEFIKLSNAINGAVSNDVSDEDIDEVFKNAEKKLKLLKDMWNGNLKNMLGGSSSEKDTTQEFDWIEQAIENVEKEVKELDDVVNSAYSTFSQKNDALAKEISKVSEEIALQQKAYEEYMQKADSIGLPDNYKELVQNGAVNIEDIIDEKIQEQIDAYQKWYDKAQNVSDAIKELKTDLKDLHVSAYELNTSDLKDRLDNDSITEKEYLKGLKTAYEQFYANLEDYAQQYHEAVLEYLRQEKDYLNSVASAATYLLDTEIDSIRDSADEQEEQIKRQIELLEDRKKPLQDELDALEDKVRKEEFALNLQKAQYELAKAENQRTKLVKYMPDAIVI